MQIAFEPVQTPEEINAMCTLAAKMLSLERLHHAAVICSREAAEKYGLTVLEENIQNARDNCTRFIVISRTPCLPQNADKISLCFSLPNTPGALHQVLGRFALNGLNLTKIESRPIPGKAFEYDFYLDFTGIPYAGAAVLFKRRAAEIHISW